ncbi:MAG: phosphopantetheine-binding protein [Gammaproteobacteria bacterium]
MEERSVDEIVRRAIAAACNASPEAIGSEVVLVDIHLDSFGIASAVSEIEGTLDIELEAEQILRVFAASTVADVIVTVRHALAAARGEIRSFGSRVTPGRNLAMGEARAVDFWEHAERSPHHVAVIDEAGREWSAAELGGEAHRVAHALRDLGVGAGWRRRGSATPRASPC